MMKPALLKMHLAACTLSVTLFAATAFAHGDGHHGSRASTAIAKDVHAWGQQGDPKQVTRTIMINMSDDMRFSPDAVMVKQGETIRFVVGNTGKLLHEMVIGTRAELEKHAEMMKRHPNMEHDEPYMAHVAAGKRSEIIWQFSKVGEFEFACLIPGHFEAGMRGKVSVQPRR